MRRTALFTLGALVAGTSLAAEDVIPGDTPPLYNPEFRDTTFDPDTIDTGFAIAKGGAQAGGVGMKCMACHGIAGGGSGLIPKLAALPQDYLMEQLEAYIEGHRESRIMSEISRQLTEDEKTAVTTYFASLDPPPTPPLEDADTELVQWGGQLAQAGHMPDDGPEITACVQCHYGSADDGSMVAPPLAGQQAAYIEAQLRAWQNGNRSNSALGVMAGIAKAMSDRDIEAVAAYFASHVATED